MEQHRFIHMYATEISTHAVPAKCPTIDWWKQRWVKLKTARETYLLTQDGECSSHPSSTYSTLLCSQLRGQLTSVWEEGTQESLLFSSCILCGPFQTPTCFLQFNIYMCIYNIYIIYIYVNIYLSIYIVIYLSIYLSIPSHRHEYLFMSFHRLSSPIHLGGRISNRVSSMSWSMCFR